MKTEEKTGKHEALRLPTFIAAFMLAWLLVGCMNAPVEIAPVQPVNDNLVT